MPKPVHHTIPLIGVRCMDMIAEGKLKKEELEDFGKIVFGDSLARENDEEIILSVGGMHVEDVAWATVVY